MAHFYGGVQGHRGQATRLGTKSAGIRAFAKSWGTQVDVNYWYDEENDVNIVRVSMRLESTGESVMLFNGSEKGLQRRLQQRARRKVLRAMLPCKPERSSVKVDA